MRSALGVTASLVLLTAFSGVRQAAEAQGSSELERGWIVSSWTTPQGQVDTVKGATFFARYQSGSRDRSIREYTDSI